MSDLNDSSTWALIASIAGAAATAVTAVNGLSRLSRLAKARRTIEWVNSTIDKGANDKSRNRTLAEMRREQESLSKQDIEFECIASFNEQTGEPEWETLNIREMEILAESEYREQQQNPQ